MSLIWHDVIILTVKSLNTRFREPLRKAIRAALGWFTSAFCGLGGGGLLTAAGGDLHINTVTISITIIYYLKPARAKEVIHTWKCWGCCLAFAPPVWVRLRALPSSSAYPAKHTLISQTHTYIQTAGIDVIITASIEREKDGILPAGAWWRIVSGEEKVHSPPTGTALGMRLYRHDR